MDKMLYRRGWIFFLPLLLFYPFNLLPLSAQDFTVSGSIPGIRKGCEVRITAVHGHGKREIAKGVTGDGCFTVSGTVDGPTLVSIAINDKPEYGAGEYPCDRGVKFVLEDVPVTISAAHFDSIPLSYEPGGTPLRLECNVKIAGGEAQRHYQEWRDYIYDAELAEWQAGHLLWMHRFGRRIANKNDAEKAKTLMENAERAAEKTVDYLNGVFIAEHPSYAISLLLQRERLEDMFTYTDAELDSILSLLKDNEDKAGYERLAEHIAVLRKFTKGTPYTDFEVCTTDGSVKRLSDCIRKGVYNYIDFWASWCGPCRAAIPKVKELHAQTGDRLNIISVSVDKDEAAWRRAMVEEQMPWTQLLVSKESASVLREAYKLTSIPCLLIIDPEGRIIMSTHNPNVAEDFLRSMEPAL